MNLDRVVLDDYARPDGRREGALGHQFARGPDQHFDNVERSATDRNWNAVRPQLTLAKIDLPAFGHVDPVLVCPHPFSVLPRAS